MTSQLPVGRDMVRCDCHIGVSDDVQASVVIATRSVLDSCSFTSSLTLLYNSGTHLLVKCCRDGLVYRGSNVFIMSRKPSFSTSEYGLMSLTMNQVIETVFGKNSLPSYLNR